MSTAGGWAQNKTMKLEFAKRATIRDCELSRQRIYPSRCGRFEVVEATEKATGIKRWLAVRVLERGAYIISRHRTRKAAEEACE